MKGVAQEVMERHHLAFRGTGDVQALLPEHGELLAKLHNSDRGQRAYGSNRSLAGLQASSRRSPVGT